jgi:MFS family permease
MGMSIEHVADANRATAMGLHQAVYSIGMVSGPWLSGILADSMGIQPMFGVTAFVCLVSGLFMTRWLRQTSRAVLLTASESDNGRKLAQSDLSIEVENETKNRQNKVWLDPD